MAYILHTRGVFFLQVTWHWEFGTSYVKASLPGERLNCIASTDNKERQTIIYGTIVQIRTYSISSNHSQSISQAPWLPKIAKRLPSWLCSFSLKQRQHALAAFAVIDQIWGLIPTYLNFPAWLSWPTHITLSLVWVSSATPLFFFSLENLIQLSKLPRYFPLLSFWHSSALLPLPAQLEWQWFAHSIAL